MGYWYIPPFEDEVKPHHYPECGERAIGKAKARNPGYHREECQHRDCAEVRELRKKKCPVCSVQFEVDDRVCGEPPKHFGCAIQEAES